MHWRIPFLLWLVIGLTACDPMAEPDNMMDTYLERLARVLELQPQKTDLLQVMTLPRPRDRRVEIEPLEINMLDFLSLYGCELQVVVGERNSIMGRVMTPLNQLRYQLRFINKARQCLPKVEKQALQEQLKRAIEHKQANLPAYFWNSVWADEPMASLMTQSKGLYQRDTDRNLLGSLSNDIDHAMTVLSQLKSGPMDSELKSMGEIQQRWVFSHTPGQLINSARLLITRLNDATQIIEGRLGDKPLCYLNKPNSQSDRVKGVFFKVYIGRIQPYLAQVSQAGEQLFGKLSALAAAQEALMPEKFRPFYQQVLNVKQPENIWQKLDKAIERHTKSWQRLLSQCGMQPMAG